MCKRKGFQTFENFDKFTGIDSVKYWHNYGMNGKENFGYTQR